MKLLSFVALGLALASPLAAQRSRDRDRDRDPDDEYQSRLDTTLAFDRRGVVDLSIVTGDIVVSGWNRDEVRIHAYSGRGELHSELTRGRVALEVRSRRGHIGDTRFELTVPVGTRVISNSTSGDISVRGVKGEVEAHTVSGDLEIDDADGRVTFDVVSGDVSGSRIRGNVHGSSVSGDIELEDVIGDVEASSTSGEIALPNAQSKFVRTETVSGDVTYDGTIDPSGRYQFRSHSGDVRLRIPSNVGARLSVETFSGTIDSAFPITLQPGDRSAGRPRRFDFTLGGGGASISLETFSSDITIERGDSRSGARVTPEGA